MLQVRVLPVEPFFLFKSVPYTKVDNSSLWAQLGATSSFSAGSSKPIPSCSATSSRNATSSLSFEYASVLLRLAWPSQKQTKSSGVCCFFDQVVRNRKACAPAFGCLAFCRSGWSQCLRVFDGKRLSVLRAKQET